MSLIADFQYYKNPEIFILIRAVVNANSPKGTYTLFVNGEEKQVLKNRLENLSLKIKIAK